MIYELTEPGQRVLILSKVRLWELFKEVFEKELSPDTAGHVERALRIAVAGTTAPKNRAVRGERSEPPRGRHSGRSK